uniref:Putative secreted protein n=1 Tax=Anopheles marajoara TaxID=58244 RepID=A0A2M4CGU7_9DIPT
MKQSVLRLEILILSQTCVSTIVLCFRLFTNQPPLSLGLNVFRTQDRVRKMQYIYIYEDVGLRCISL